MQVVRHDKQRVFQAMGYKPCAPEVNDFHASPARRRIISAPARTSKSFAGAHDSAPDGIPDFVRYKGKLVPLETKLSWSVGPTYSTNKEFEYWWDNLVEKGVLQALGGTITKAQNNSQNGNMVIVAEFGRAPDGRMAKGIWEGKSATNERDLQGEQINGACVMSEAAEQDERIWTKYLSTRCPNAIFPTTPKVRAEWLYRMIEKAEANPGGDTAHFTFSPHANPRFDWDNFWIEHGDAEFRAHSETTQLRGNHDCLLYEDGQVTVNPACRAKDDPDFAEQFLGQWTFQEGRVLPFLWRPGMGTYCNVVDFDPDWRDDLWFWSFDYGYTHPYVGLLWRVERLTGTALIVDSFYDTKLNDDDVTDRILEREEKHHCAPRWYCADPKRPEVGDLLLRRGFPVAPIEKKTQSDRAATHKALVNALSPDPRLGHPRLFVHARNTSVVQEWKKLHQKTDTANEWGANALGKQDDHAFDAARYGVPALDLCRPSERTRKSQMSSIAQITWEVENMARETSLARVA